MPLTAEHSAPMQGAHRYFAWQREFMTPVLGRRVIEIGCGAGGFTPYLFDRDIVVSVDASREAIEYVRSRFPPRENWHTLVADLLDEDLPRRLSRFRCDTVVALNVIEHIADDRRALRALRSLLPSGGGLALLVPAHPRLFGRFDREVGHHRRYTKAEVNRKVTETGFSIERASYFNMVGALGWWFNYRLLDRGAADENAARQIPWFDRWVVPWARWIEQRLPSPFGLSVFCLARAR